VRVFQGADGVHISLIAYQQRNALFGMRRSWSDYKAQARSGYEKNRKMRYLAPRAFT
jgi:hypothetical protein